MSDISQNMQVKAFSELTTGSNFEAFYNKWEGIVKSGTNHADDLHFFDSNAFLKLP